MYTLFFLAMNAVTLGLECGFFFLLSQKIEICQELAEVVQ